MTSRKTVAYRVNGRGDVTAVTISPEMDAAADILQDANMLDEKRLRLLKAAEEDGRNPEHFARHLAKLGRAFNQKDTL